MSKFDNILEILEKEEISEVEKKELDKLISIDMEIKNFVEIYLKLDRVFNTQGHIDLEILAEFVLYYDGDLDIASYINQITDKIEDHLTKCSDCNNEYIALSKDFQDVDGFMAKSITDEVEEDIEFEKPPSIITKVKRSNYRTFLTAIALLAITYSGMMLTSSYTTPFYKQNIFSFKELTNSNDLISNNPSVKEALLAIKNEKYDVAIGLLLKDVLKNPNDSTLFYSHYLIGLAYLKSSESNFLGVFKSYDHLRVDEGIENLLESVRKNNSGIYKKWNLSAHYYVAKAFLALDEVNHAIEHLQIVVNERGVFYSDANKILKAFENN